MSRESKVHTLTASTAAKDLVRNDIDRGLIEAFRDKYYPDQKLSYLGLPGVQLLDVLSWREFIGYCTAVEDTSATEALELNVMKNRLEGILQVIYADINDILCSTIEDPRLRWPYEIVNLDYAGGLVHRKDDGTSRKLDALKSLFAKQEAHAFALFLTLNLRDKDKGELERLVKQQETDLQTFSLDGAKECFEKHRALGHAGLLKLYVPIFLMNEATRHELTFLSPILYQGTRQMMHFAVECVPYSAQGSTRVLITEDRIREINRPLLVLRDDDDLRAVDLGAIGYSS